MIFFNKLVSTKLHRLVKRDIVTMQTREVHPSPFAFPVDWLQSLKQIFINMSYHILVAGLTLMALLTEPSEID